jgi:C-terminal processing protease CtpA/Prc
MGGQEMFTSYESNLLQVDGVKVAGMPLHSISDMILGAEGTIVHLEVYHQVSSFNQLRILQIPLILVFG